MNKLHAMVVYLRYFWSSKRRGISLPVIRWMLSLWRCLVVNLLLLHACVEKSLASEQALGNQPSFSGWGEHGLLQPCSTAENFRSHQELSWAVFWDTKKSCISQATVKLEKATIWRYQCLEVDLNLSFTKSRYLHYRNYLHWCLTDT